MASWDYLKTKSNSQSRRVWLEKILSQCEKGQPGMGNPSTKTLPWTRVPACVPENELLQRKAGTGRNRNSAFPWPDAGPRVAKNGLVC